MACKRSSPQSNSKDSATSLKFLFPLLLHKNTIECLNVGRVGATTVKVEITNGSTSL